MLNSMGILLQYSKVRKYTYDVRTKGTVRVHTSTVLVHTVRTSEMPIPNERLPIPKRLSHIDVSQNPHRQLVSFFVKSAVRSCTMLLVGLEES
jgi:hypothetical protein